MVTDEEGVLLLVHSDVKSPVSPSLYNSLLFIASPITKDDRQENKGGVGR
jgi:hypothetical protein